MHRMVDELWSYHAGEYSTRHDEGQCAGGSFWRDAVGCREAEGKNDRGIGATQEGRGAEQPKCAKQYREGRKQAG